jgi:hypothetical protein
VSSREKQKKKKNYKPTKTHCNFKTKEGSRLQVSRPGLRSQIRSIQVSRSGLRSQMWSLQVSNILDWVFKYGSLHAPNILDWDLKYDRSTSQYSGLRSQIRSLQILRYGFFFFFFFRSQINYEHGTFWEFSFWELHRTSSPNCELIGNFMEQVLLTVSFLGTLWNKFSMVWVSWELYGTSSLN